jgi:hypothetical protein
MPESSDIELLALSNKALPKAFPIKFVNLELNKTTFYL